MALKVVELATPIVIGLGAYLLLEWIRGNLK